VHLNCLVIFSLDSILLVFLQYWNIAVVLIMSMNQKLTSNLLLFLISDIYAVVAHICHGDYSFAYYSIVLAS